MVPENYLKDAAIGIDIEEIERFEPYISNKNNSLLLRLFTQDEIEYCFVQANPAQNLAARFCAKEAVYKALCNLNVKIPSLKEIEIIKTENKIPKIRLNNAYNNKFDVKISLSHSKKYAVANALVIKTN